jgi:hypothetical protein
MDMLIPARDDLERRRRIWPLCAEPLLGWIFDEGLTEEDYRRVGAVARELGYSPDEVRAIYWQEVIPAIRGSWRLFGEKDWLERHVLQPRPLRYFVSLFLFPLWTLVAWDEWRKIKKWLSC